MRFIKNILFAILGMTLITLISACGGTATSAGLLNKPAAPAQVAIQPSAPTATVASLPTATNAPEPTEAPTQTTVRTVSVAKAAEPVPVQITLSEWKIESSMTTFDVGTPYHLLIKNSGKIAHELEIAPLGENNPAKALLDVKPQDLRPGVGLTRDVTFTQAGSFQFTCQLPEHVKAGMVLAVTVQ